MISVEGVSKRFGDTAALRDLSFEVPTGGTLGLVGPGGGGKSLILKLICGLLRPDAGRIHVDADEITATGETDLMRVRGRIGMIFQNNALFDFMDVGRNVGFPLARLGTVPPATVRARVAERLAQVNLDGIEELMPQELSGGMRKRVCLARATIHDPPVMLCDDPTAGLDPVTTNRIFRLLKTLQAKNSATAIIVSHEVGYLRPICDRFLMLEAGDVRFLGTFEEGIEGADPGVRRFLSGEVAH